MVDTVLWCGHVNGTGSLVFIDDVTDADRSSRMNPDVYRSLLSAQIQPNAAKLRGRCFTAQMDDDPKYTAKTTQELLKAETCNVLGRVSHQTQPN